MFALVCALALLAGACGNAKDGGSSPTTRSTQTTTASDAEKTRDEHVSLSGVPGVTDKEIRYAVIGTKANNPLGTCILDCYLDGIKAYFAYRNSEGGIYGRKLVINDIRDDQVSQNQVESLAVISNNESFGDFQATLLASGWEAIDKAGIPTYVWGIDAVGFANRPHIFPSLVNRCPTCYRQDVAYAAMKAGKKRAASLGYSVNDASKTCANSTGEGIKAFSKDTGVDLAYTNDHLAYGLPNGIGPEVTAMKKAKVDFITTCIDLNGMKTLAQELHRQGQDDVVLFHPNTYNQQFISEAGDLFEGDYVSALFRPFEADPAGTAVTDFQKWMKKQGSDQTELAMVGWINATLAYDGLLAAGPEFDREKVTSATAGLTAWTGGGLVAPIDWSTAHTPFTQDDPDPKQALCSGLMRVKDHKLTTVGPTDKPFLCWPHIGVWSSPTFKTFQ
jgi:hypothetical protein